ncbi:MAG: thymidine kinase [Verrucomicrobiota bacterium]
MSEAGRIEVVCGPMFAGKTEELLRRVRRAVIAGRDVLVVNHVLDTRQEPGRLLSHAGVEHPSLGASSAAEIERLATGRSGTIAIDEAQFFGSELVAVAGRLAARGLIVLVAGLDVTYEGFPFEPLPSLMALAERVDKLTAICAVCGEEAVYHARLAPTAAGATDFVSEHIGSEELYQARCRRHFALA